MSYRSVILERTLHLTRLINTKISLQCSTVLSCFTVLVEGCLDLVQSFPSFSVLQIFNCN